MPISVRCSACGRGHKAPDQAAGKTFKCLACGERLTIPSATIDPADLLLGIDESSSTPLEHSDEVSESDPAPETPKPSKKTKARPTRPKPDLASLPPLTTDDPPLWRRHLHWLLVLAMIPLGTSLLTDRDEPDLLSRIPPHVQDRFLEAIFSGASKAEAFEILPENRLRGAWLPHSTYTHWGMALVATVIFLVFFMFLASDGSAQPMQVLFVGLFTATIGVGFLMLVQLIASFTEGRIMVGGSIITIFFYIFKFIAYSYIAASDPENEFILSFLGFTLGVGLCEELVKTMPLFWHPQESRGKSWRGIFIWGLASGAGFGIAEGILYSSRYYNGIGGPGIYVVRFLSCVALHAIWSGSVAITLYLRRDMFASISSWQEWIGPMLVVIGIPMVLHGLYDTSLKREMNAVALLVAIASFGWLAYLTSRLYGTDDEDATRAMLAEYKRRKGAM